MKNPKKIVASGLIGLIAFGGLAVGAPAAYAQDAPTPDAPTTQEDGERPTREERQAAREARKAERIEMLTNLLGVSADELAEARQSGQSLADVAAAQGVDVQVVIDALVADKTARIEARIAEGNLSDAAAERAAEKLANVEERVTARVNGERGPRGPRG